MSKKFDNLHRSFIRKQARRRRALERFSINLSKDTDNLDAYVVRKEMELMALNHKLGG
jgi:hypothetical protein